VRFLRPHRAMANYNDGILETYEPATKILIAET
jgi:hypothetical protein